MEVKTGDETTATANAGAKNEGRQGRKRWEMSSENVRYFLPKTGTGSGKPELGEEMPTEGEALVQAFQKGQQFYTVVVWKAAADTSGHVPTIVKQALKQTRG